jgi:diguanylate cyclase (GGDEF)-like protein/PAS domain S-box-containing protein
VNAALDRVPSGYLSTLADGTIVEANAAFLEWTGFERDDLVRSKRFRDLLTVGGRIFHETHYAPLLHMQGEVREISFDIVTSDGRPLPVVVNSVLDRDSAGKPAAIRTTVTYARDRHEYERELMRSRDAERRARERAEGLQHLTARLARALDGVHVAQLVVSDAIGALGADEGSIAIDASAGCDAIAHARRPDNPDPSGNPRVWLSTPLVVHGATAGVLCVGRGGDPGVPAAEMAYVAACADQCVAALERIRLFTAVTHLAGTDELTGLPNRRTWAAQGAREFARARRTGEPVSLAILDLDHFKRFNDTHGHPAGDALLKRVAATWSSLLRADDILARHGGEEFALLLSGCASDRAVALVERLRTALPHGATCSAGVAEWDGAETPDALFSRADRALYDAKAAGRDRLAFAPEKALRAQES